MAPGEPLTHKTLFLSTSADDRPFVAPLYFAESDSFHLTMIFDGAGRSLTNVTGNPNVTVMISTGSPFDLCLQGEGYAEVISDPQQLVGAMNAVRAKAPRSSF